MRFTTYSKYKGRWLDALNLESLMEFLSDFLMDGGFAGGPNYHPYWGWSGTDDTSSTDALKNALLMKGVYLIFSFLSRSFGALQARAIEGKPR